MEQTNEMDIDSVNTAATIPQKSHGIRFEVEMYGDTVCPWCFLAKKNLDKAIETYASKYPDDGDIFDIIWKPFILWPTAEVSAYDKRAPILGMVGPIRAPGVFERLAAAGAEYGIHFNWEGLVGNSADANKLVVLAYEMDQKLRAAQQQEEQTTNEFSSPSQPQPQPQPQRYQTPSPDPPFTDKSNNPSPNDIPAHPSPPPSPPSPSSTPRLTTLPIQNPTQHTFLEALFHSTFTQGFDPSNRTFLISLALSIDPPLAESPSELLSYLDSDEANLAVGLEPTPKRSPIVLRTSQHKWTSRTYNGGRGSAEEDPRTTVLKDKEKAKEKEKEKEKPSPNHLFTPSQKKDLKTIINGVPSVVVQGRYRVGGMQKAEVYLAVFEKVREGFLLSSSLAGKGEVDGGVESGRKEGTHQEDDREETGTSHVGGCCS